MRQALLPLAVLVASISAAGQEQSARTTRQLPAPTDIDAALTEELRRVEDILSPSGQDLPPHAGPMSSIMEAIVAVMLYVQWR